jgi:hypothetical protein
MKSKKITTFFRALAPKEYTTSQIVEILRKDPYQTRFSFHPINLKHPRTGVVKPLSEFIEDVVGDSRFAIETENDLIFVSRIMITENYAGFFPVKVLSKKLFDKTNPENIFN